VDKVAEVIFIVTENAGVHSIESDHCWCHPVVKQVCPECNGDKTVPCWKCKGQRLVDEYDSSLPAIVIHRSIPLREL